MAKITFITNNNETIVAEANSGTVMELAKESNVEGIDGDCGGVCSCATCHVHVSEADYENVGAPGEIEADMLELEDNYNERSRLCCQIDVTEDLDGVTLYVAN